MATKDLESKIKKIKQNLGEKKPESFKQQVERVRSKYSKLLTKKKEEKMSNDLKKKHIGFKKLEQHVEKEGYSKKAAADVAADVGRKKYGNKEMAEKAEAGKMKKGESLKKEHEGFKKVENHIKKEGYSKKGAAAAAAAIGRKKYGNKGMAEKAEAGKMHKSEDKPVYEHKGVHLHHVKDLGHGHHAFRVLDGEHAGKWTKLHESEVKHAKPLDKSEDDDDDYKEHESYEEPKESEDHRTEKEMRTMKIHAKKPGIFTEARKRMEEHKQKEALGKAKKNPSYEEGVHAEMGDMKHMRGKSPAGEYLRAGHKENAKNMHQKVLVSLKSMKKPNLTKAAPEGVNEKKYKDCKQEVAAKQHGSEKHPYNVYAVCASALKKMAGSLRGEPMEKCSPDMMQKAKKKLPEALKENEFKSGKNKDLTKSKKHKKKSKKWKVPGEVP